MLAKSSFQNLAMHSETNCNQFLHATNSYTDFVKPMSELHHKLARESPRNTGKKFENSCGNCMNISLEVEQISFFTIIFPYYGKCLANLLIPANSISLQWAKMIGLSISFTEYYPMGKRFLKNEVLILPTGQLQLQFILVLTDRYLCE